VPGKKEDDEPPVSENKEPTVQSVATNGLCTNCRKSIQDDIDDLTSNGTANFLALERDMSVRIYIYYYWKDEYNFF